MSTIAGAAAGESTGASTREGIRYKRAGNDIAAGPKDSDPTGGLARNRNASDDEILGIDISAHGERKADQAPVDREGTPASDKDSAKTDEAGQTEAAEKGNKLEAVLGANPELKKAWEDARAYRESFRTPEEARTATAALADLARMDALFFSGQPQDHAELAKVVASLNPAAFRSLAKAMSEVANQEQGTAGDGRPARVETFAAPDASRAPAPEKQTGLNTGQEQFLQSTNAAAVQAVIESIESQVERLLPEEISKGARNRLVGEIYRELDASLRADRQFSNQAREAFRSGKLDEEHQRAIVSMVNSRAKQALPAVARRVLNEWTSAIVAANQDRRARQRAAEKRVDIAGSGRTANDGGRAMTPKDINYSRMSDADILNL